MTSTQLKTPSKRPRLDLVENDEDTLQECSSIRTAQETDVTFDPAEAGTSITEPQDLYVFIMCRWFKIACFIFTLCLYVCIFFRAQASSPVQNIRKYIVYETCIMELFEVCPVCQRSCHVRSQKLGTFLRVEQLCHHCHFSRKWNSQPIMGSTPAGNLHLSAAVYLCGASFFTIEKVLEYKILNIYTDTKHL